MNPTNLVGAFTCSLLLTSALAAYAQTPVQRPIPQPRNDHPGNVFLRGEEVVVDLPDDSAWTLRDYEDRSLGQFKGGKATPGRLPTGHYRLFSGTSSNWISLAVLQPLSAPTPLTSPIGLDVAMAWFYPTQRMDAVASLCALAGVNWVRDRLTWAEMEPERGRFSAWNKYDASALAQSAAGLQVLQVIHHSPSWANPVGKRFPLDLRDAYRFFEAMAKRWRGQVLAFEPWNEADIPMFGGHTGAEMASFQKASYLGLKAGNPDMIACWNVFALHNTNQLADMRDNQAYPFFDTYNLHHYEAFENYPGLYADHRAVSAGRPLWVTECARPVPWAGDPALKEPTETDLKVQAERVARTIALSLHEGSAATFYFLLPHYVEGRTQFGIVRPDLTPRPAFVALAAAGRLLAAARPLGKMISPDNAAAAYLFNARPDGEERIVLVAWATEGTGSLPLSEAPERVFDHLGRELTRDPVLPLTSAPRFALLSADAVKALKVNPPPARPDLSAAPRPPVVLQAIWPAEKVDLRQSAYVLAVNEPEKIPIYLYNLGASPATGRLQVEAPAGWTAATPADWQLPPWSRTEAFLTVDKGAPPGETARIRLVANFEGLGESVLSLRLIAR